MLERARRLHRELRRIGVVRSGSADGQLPAGVETIETVGDESDHDLSVEAVGFRDVPDLEEHVAPWRLRHRRHHRQSTMSTDASVPSLAAAARTSVRMA